MEQYREGQQVRIVIEGPVRYDTTETTYGSTVYTRLSIGDNEVFVNDPDWPDTKVTCEVIRQPLREGQVYKTTDGTRWFIRNSSTRHVLLLAISQRNESARVADQFIAMNPNAELLLDVEGP